MQKQIHHHPQRRTRFRSPYRPDGYFVVTKGKAYPRSQDHDLGGGSLMPCPRKMLCINCRTANKEPNIGTDICPRCGKTLVRIAPRIRVPRKNASDRTWKIFIRRFIDRNYE